jgi:hypothetical protein
MTGSFKWGKTSVVAMVTSALAMVTSALALSVAAAVLAPSALAAGTVHRCGNIKVTLTEMGAEGKTTSFHLPVKQITAQGVTCAAAIKFIKLQFKNTTGAVPLHYKCKTGHFKVPLGMVPQVCTRPGVKIQYAAQGG